MADQGHTAILKQGVEAWNKWRKENPDLLPDLTGVDFSGMDFSYENLSGANFNNSELVHTDLSDAYLQGATLCDATLSCTNLYGATLTGADLTGAILSEATLKEADLRCAILKDANLVGVIFREVQGLSIEQLSKVKTLYKTIELDEHLLKQVTQRYPDLLKAPEEQP